MNKSLTRRRFLRTMGRGALLCAGCALFPDKALAVPDLEKGFVGAVRSPYFEALGNSVTRCTLCPHGCETGPGERGVCGVRENRDGEVFSLVYGNPCALNVDPVEKKPFYHVLPGTRSFSLATAGCNFDCKFCQNWEISQARPEETFNYAAPPEKIVEMAERYRCASIASTYVEPTIFMEYMQAVGRRVKGRPMLKVMHSNGFVNEKPLGDLCDVLDAACIDLKSFSESYYREVAEGELPPVKRTLERLAARKVHTELVNLVVPGLNDDMAAIAAMCAWVREALSPDTPIHFTRFYPRYKLQRLSPTPVATLEQAREMAITAGLRYAYVGNVPNHPGNHTWCPECGKKLIRRVGYRTTVEGLDNGRCVQCGFPVAGIWSIA